MYILLGKSAKFCNAATKSDKIEKTSKDVYEYKITICWNGSESYICEMDLFSSKTVCMLIE